MLKYHSGVLATGARYGRLAYIINGKAKDATVCRQYFSEAMASQNRRVEPQATSVPCTACGVLRHRTRALRPDRPVSY